MTAKRFGCLWLPLILVLGFSLLLNLCLIVADGDGGYQPNGPAKLSEQILRAGVNSSSDRIVAIPVRGEISADASGHGPSMAGEILRQLRQAGEDDRVKAVVLLIDSPGGEVTASDMVYRAVLKVRARKPVVVSMGSMAASGGYYIACGGNYLIANPTTFTGSIGVIIASFQYSELLGKIGVKPVTFKSGAFKDMLSGTRDMTPEETAYIQELVMQTYAIFVGIVAKERKLDEAKLRGGPADGRVITGADALKAKLIDALGDTDDAYAKAKELAKTPDAMVVAYETKFSLGRLFQALSSERSNGKIEVNLAQQLLPALKPGRAYWLPPHYAP